MRIADVRGSFHRCLVLGASGGIGSAFVRALEADGANVERLSRRDGGVDLTDEDSLETAISRLSPGAFDLVVNATGILAPDGTTPEKALSAIEPGAMMRVFQINAVGGALALKHALPLLASDRRAVFATLSARVGSIGDNGLGGWMSYRASKAALNQVVRCAAIEAARTRPQSVIVALHPGTIDTPLSRPHARGRFTADADEAARTMLGTLDRLTPAETGGFFAYDGSVIPW